MNDNDPTSVYIADVLDRAQKCATAIVDPAEPAHDRTAAMLSFICHVQTSVLLANLARHNQQLADELVGWFDRIFEDGYAAELVHEWRQQITAGHLMHPINPAEEDAVDADEDLIDQLRKLAVPVRIADEIPEAVIYCGAVSDIGVNCGKPDGHTDDHAGTGTDEYGEPMFSRWSNTEADGV